MRTVIFWSITVTAGLLMGLAPTRLVAAPEVPLGQEGALAKLVPPIHGRKSCYARSYDAAHLKRHPRQRVRSVLLQIRYDYPEAREKYQEPYYWYRLEAQVRGRRATLYTYGTCAPYSSTIRCGVECDGGAFLLRLQSDGTLGMAIDERLRMTGCGEDDAVELTPGADDKLFRLHEVGDASCRSLDSKTDP